jgi:hypothetical protein
MNKVLLIETSPRGNESLSRKAGRLLIEQLKKKGPIKIFRKKTYRTSMLIPFLRIFRRPKRIPMSKERTLNFRIG